jgi:transcriptional regulator with PAS, ATPase and Fis domain
MGALYVDSRVHRAPLTARARDLLMALADQVAVALSNVRLHASLEQRSRELAAEKQTVERLAQGQDRELRRLREQLESQRRTLEFRYDYAQIVGRGPGMRAVLTELDRIVDADVNVLIQGESGTGKELIARAIHVHGPRKAGPFVAINCAALPESLLESELFGYVRGAFTGADRDKTGLMLAARGGTLFLDELGELPLSIQAKLLRVLQEREVRPLGSERALPLDVRLVCATHRELLQAAANGEFRQDLFYRIAVVTVRLPPLRERVEDLPELARSILSRLAKSADRPAPELGRDALRALSAHPFPGNIRELENVLTRAFVISGGARIGAGDLELSRSIAPAPRSTSKKAFAIEERQRILEALNATRWNVSVVSRTLGIPRNTLYRKLQRYGLTRD